MSYRPLDFAFNGKQYKHYFEVGGGIGDIFMIAVFTGILFFIENKLNAPMLILLWCKYDHVRQLFAGYKNVDVIVYTTDKYPLYPFAIESTRKKLGMQSHTSDFMKEYSKDLGMNMEKYMGAKGINEMYLRYHAFPRVEFENLKLPNISLSDITIIARLGGLKYIVLNPTTGTFNHPHTYISAIVEILCTRFIVVLAGITDNRNGYKYIVPTHLLYSKDKGKGIIDIRDRTSLHGIYHVIDKSFAVFMAMSSLFLFSAICNKPCMLLIDDQRINSYHDIELTKGRKSSWTYKFYLYQPTTCILMMDATKYRILNKPLGWYNIRKCTLKEGNFAISELKDVPNQIIFKTIIDEWINKLI